MLTWTVFYGAIAVAALLVTHGKPCAAMGRLLLITFAACTFAGMLVSAPWRAILYIALDLAMVLATARHLARAPVVSAAILTISVLSIAATAAFVWFRSDEYALIHLWEVSVNVLFALSCFCLIGGRAVDVALGPNRSGSGTGDLQRGANRGRGIRVASK